MATTIIKISNTCFLILYGKVQIQSVEISNSTFDCHPRCPRNRLLWFFATIIEWKKSFQWWCKIFLSLKQPLCTCGHRRIYTMYSWQNKKYPLSTTNVPLECFCYYSETGNVICTNTVLGCLMSIVIMIRFRILLL